MLLLLLFSFKLNYTVIWTEMHLKKCLCGHEFFNTKRVKKIPMNMWTRPFFLSLYTWVSHVSPPSASGGLPVSFRVPDVHVRPVHRQRNSSRHALQWGLVSGEGPLPQEGLQLDPLPAPEPRHLHHPACWQEVCGNRSPLCRRPERLGWKLHLSVLRREELFSQTGDTDVNQSHLGLIWFQELRPCLNRFHSVMCESYFL